MARKFRTKEAADAYVRELKGPPVTMTSPDARSSSDTPEIQVPVDAVLDVIAWWRGANEAPGGCSTRDAIKGMSKAVFALADAARKAGHDC